MFGRPTLRLWLIANALMAVCLGIALPQGMSTRGAVVRQYGRTRRPPERHTTAGANLVAAAARARLYASAFAAGRYAAMWSSLGPAARQGWGGLAGYAAYYRIKFEPVRLLGIRFGPPRQEGDGVHVPLMLDLAWRTTGPPRILSLFRAMEATVVRVGNGWRIADGGPLDPSAPIIPPPQPRPVSVHVPILMYHHVSDVLPAPSQIDLTVTDREFAAQLDYLAAHGYRTIRLVDLFNYLYYGRPLPPRPVILTFDDGYLDNYTDAFPLLRRHGMVGEFNIITAYPEITLGVNRYMTWSQIEAMAAAGMEMESHTVDHQDLGTLSPDRADYEIHFSHAVLAAHIHRAVQFLAYPSGEPFRSGTPAAQEEILALLPRYGYVGALLDPVSPGTLQDARYPYQLQRVRISRGESLAAFAAGLHL